MSDFTARAIKASFLKLLNEYPLHKISVRMITDGCGITRNSFYYHFQDIPTLLETILTEQTDELIRRYPTISTLDECFEMAFRFALENRKAVMHIYHSVNRDLFDAASMRLCEYAVTTYINTAFSSQSLREEDRPIVIHFICCELFGLCLNWIAGGMDDSAMDSLRRMLRLCQDLPEAVARRSREAEEG